MAKRQLAQREVTSLYPEQDFSGDTLQMGAKLAGNLSQMAFKLQEAQDDSKMANNMAEANLKMMAATAKFRQENSSDPTNQKALNDLNKQ